MNSILKPFILILSLIFVFYSCAQQEDRNGKEEMKTFTTPEEAAAKAKSDLIELLETQEDLNLQVDISRLRNAELVELIQYLEIDFTKLLNTDSVRSLSDITGSEKNMIAPFVLENSVVSTAEVGKKGEGWQVSGLNNPAVTNDLNTAGIMGNKNAKVTLYEVPNLQVWIYSVQEDTAERYFLNYQNFSQSKASNLKEFYPVLREDARRFQEEFGDRLKDEKLVK
jgi:hypothetical protein